MQKSIVLRGQRVAFSFERKRVRRVSLRIRAEGGLFVSAPRLTPYAVVEAFLLAKQDWILEQLRLAAERQAEDENAVYLWGERLRLELREGKRHSVAREGDALILTLKDPSDGEEKRRALEAWQKQICTERVTALCRQYYPAFERRGVPWPTLSFRRMRSRWGSCRP